MSHEATATLPRRQTQLKPNIPFAVRNEDPAWILHSTSQTDPEMDDRSAEPELRGSRQSGRVASRVRNFTPSGSYRDLWRKDVRKVRKR